MHTEINNAFAALNASLYEKDQEWATALIETRDAAIETAKAAWDGPAHRFDYTTALINHYGSMAAAAPTRRSFAPSARRASRKFRPSR